MIKEQFQCVLENFNDGNKKVSSSSVVYDALVRQAPQLLKSEFPRKDLLFKGSVGQGNKTDYPWLCVFNINITRSAQFGLYIVFLFKKDMSGFYLTLSQGVTYFDEMYRSKKYDAVKKVVKYFQKQINTDLFSKEKINLGATSKSTLGYGYQATTILSKYYESKKFDDKMIISDLRNLIDIYDFIYAHMSTDSYKDIIARIVTYESSKNEQKDSSDIAIEKIRGVLDEVEGQPFNFSKPIREVKPFANTSNSFREITNPLIRKTDWVKKAKEDALTGLHGEGYAIIYEKERLERIGLNKYINKINQVSVKSDGYGYDIESYDLIGTEIKKIYIEVKTTSNKVDIEFQVSRGEIEKSKELKNRYFIYRVYDLKHDPKVYRVQGAITDHFELDPITYLARYKG
ncbi:MAG: DUF3578 domain-containing protein [Bacilli bacterium]